MYGGDFRQRRLSQRGRLARRAVPVGLAGGELDRDQGQLLRRREWAPPRVCVRQRGGACSTRIRCSLACAHGCRRPTGSRRPGRGGTAVYGYSATVSFARQDTAAAEFVPPAPPVLPADIFYLFKIGWAPGSPPRFQATVRTPADSMVCPRLQEHRHVTSAPQRAACVALRGDGIGDSHDRLVRGVGGGGSSANMQQRPSGLEVYSSSQYR
jgi:hypothetical protein